MPAIDGLLRAAVAHLASDLHVPTGSPPQPQHSQGESPRSTHNASQR